MYVIFSCFSVDTWVCVLWAFRFTLMLKQEIRIIENVCYCHLALWFAVGCAINSSDQRQKKKLWCISYIILHLTNSLSSFRFLVKMSQTKDFCTYEYYKNCFCPFFPRYTQRWQNFSQSFWSNSRTPNSDSDMQQ